MLSCNSKAYWPWVSRCAGCLSAPKALQALEVSWEGLYCSIGRVPWEMGGKCGELKHFE